MIQTGDNAMREVVICRGEDGFWVAECPSLPGCISQGKTKPEAIANIREAIAAWLETAQAHGQPIPEETFDAQVIAV
jgi:predicted RNase H-like HicB family nuclease